MSFWLIFLAVVIGLTYIVVGRVVRKKNLQTEVPVAPKKVSRERARELILGKGAKARKINGEVDEQELHFVMLKVRYEIGKAFGMAAKTEKNSLMMDNGDFIRPSTREHGLAAGESAEEMRLEVIREYGIDLEDLTDYDSVTMN